MNIESSDQNQSHERIRDRIVSPHAEAILKIFEKRYKKEEAVADIEVIRDIVYSFVENAIENTKIFSSEKYGVAFPYTVVKTAELSKSIYSHYKNLPEHSEAKVNSEEKENEVKYSQEFVFGSFINTGSGH
jgi:hypothetical protein